MKPRVFEIRKMTLQEQSFYATINLFFTENPPFSSVLGRFEPNSGTFFTVLATTQPTTLLEH